MNRILMIRTAITLGVLSLIGFIVSPGIAMAQTSPTSAPAPGGGVSLRPVQKSEADAAKSYFDLRGATGTTLVEAVEAHNTGADAVSLVVSPVDGLTGQTSGSVFANRQDSVGETGKWIKSSTATLDLAPGASKVVPFTVQVPGDASNGDHLAGLAFENTAPSTSPGGFQIKQVLRTVIGVLVVVPGDAAFHPSLTSLDLTQIGATQLGSVTIGLGDDGRALGRPDLTVALAGPDGYQRTLRRTLDTLLPDAAIRYPFAWPDSLPAGDYDVTATLAGGGSSVTLARHIGLNAPLVGISPAPVPMPPTPATPAGSVNLYWLAAIILAAVITGLFGGKLLRGRSRHSVDGSGQ
ncbi:MAG: putative protein of unknown function cell surface [Amycolatopsis sp.]|uniref:WxL protein peptidoglycan domain-containing protein n=1 Tax=Amycolatopsis sp. TaxID=37632 RepID=UPI00260B8094|nr:DUF916 domain-containing protein [Amycolatopsis sp.]MCU1681902.1 putative protein of unknown function cell surface [Amycolatopsis sp.]